MKFPLLCLVTSEAMIQRQRLGRHMTTPNILQERQKRQHRLSTPDLERSQRSPEHPNLIRGGRPTHSHVTVRQQSPNRVIYSTRDRARRGTTNPWSQPRLSSRRHGCPRRVANRKARKIRKLASEWNDLLYQTFQLIILDRNRCWNLWSNCDNNNNANN